MPERYSHEHSGYHWEKKEKAEKEIHGFLEFKDGEVVIKGDQLTDMNNLDEAEKEQNLKKWLQHLGSDTEVRIKVKAWEHEEVEETSDFDPWEEEQKNFGARGVNEERIDQEHQDEFYKQD